MNQFTLWQMFMYGWPVLSILGLASILSWTVICDRILVYWRARFDARAFAASVNKVIEKQGIARAMEYCSNFSKPAAVVIAQVLFQPGGREDKERALQHALQAQIREWQARVPVLGTIGSMSPFVGLFGTVVGVIKAFRDIALNVGAGPEVVSAGIAEALITTAVGLLVAIPAVVGYNYCVNKVHRLTDEIDFAAYEVIDKLSDREMPPR